MNKYLIKCINDCKTEYVVAYADSFNNELLNIAADNYAFDLAMSIVPDSFIVQAEGYEYNNLTEDAIRAIVDSIDWEEYYNYEIVEFEGDDDKFDKYPLIYDGRASEVSSDV